jgi:hypothetical protein
MAPRIVRLVNAPVAVGGAAVALLSAVAAGYALALPTPARTTITAEFPCAS